jgi:hypothetical protein
MIDRPANDDEQDLAALLAAAVIANRDEINASRIAHGLAGRIELQVNLAIRRIDIQILVRDRCTI